PQKAGKSAVQLVVYYETESGSHRRHRQRIALTCDGLVDSRCRCSKSSSSSMPLLACVIVRNLNTAHDAVVAEVQLLRISCVSDGDDEYGSLAMDQIASNLKGDGVFMLPFG
uniref:Uncharacterized protein n=1 Tax=Plectus sambesii TaxID=2011161 RepID=A0A914VQ89_9BILA